MALYVVTGGAGFIGSHLTETLLARGEQVRIVDSLITGHRRNVMDGADFVQGDLADLDVAQRAIAGADYVLHQAAIPSVPRSVQDPITSNRANIDATLVCEEPKLSPFRDEMRARLAEAAGLEPDAVNVKFTTGERMGFVGRGEGIAALAIGTVTHA